MRTWRSPAESGAPVVTAGAGHVLAGMISRLGQPHFESAVLEELSPVMPAASWSVYRTGPGSSPMLFMSASRGVPDTTRDCWRAYLSGPYLHDRTLALAQGETLGERLGEMSGDNEPLLCHITAAEMPGEHRARVYEMHGMAERVSVVRQLTDGAVLAVNFYRHVHQRAFSDAQLADFEVLAPAVLALAQKHIAMASTGLPVVWDGAGVRQGHGAVGFDHKPQAEEQIEMWRQRLAAIGPDLTPRELAVCARMLQGMTLEGVACDLRLALPTVKTYRNRAFARLGIHFRNELFARVWSSTTPTKC